MEDGAKGPTIPLASGASSGPPSIRGVDISRSSPVISGEVAMPPAQVEAPPVVDVKGAAVRFFFCFYRHQFLHPLCTES